MSYERIEISSFLNKRIYFSTSDLLTDNGVLVHDWEKKKFLAFDHEKTQSVRNDKSIIFLTHIYSAKDLHQNTRDSSQSGRLYQCIHDIYPLFLGSLYG